MIAGCFKRFPEAMLEMHDSAERGYFADNFGLFRKGVAMQFGHPDIHFTINFVLARLAAALYYDNKQLPLKLGSAIATDWYSNAQPIEPAHLKRLLSIFPQYKSLVQGTWSEEKQFESRFNFGGADKNVGGCAYHFHQCFVGTAFIFPSEADFEDADRDRLFLVTKNGIEPINGEYPKNVRMPERRSE